MAMREVIEIDEAACNGCGLCVPACPEGALQVIDGKLRLVGESLCDGLGACISECPQDAIKIVQREAVPYDEDRVIEGIASKGANLVIAHLEHLQSHGQMVYVRQALAWLDSNSRAKDIGERLNAFRNNSAQARPSVRATAQAPAQAPAHTQAPAHDNSVASRANSIEASPDCNCAHHTVDRAQEASSELFSQWPIQLHLINPASPVFDNAELLIAADCTAFAQSGFAHEVFQGRKLVIACPKLDTGREIYVEKLSALISRAKSVRIAIMEVPCCSGLLHLANLAREAAAVDIAFEVIVVGINGSIKGKSMQAPAVRSGTAMA